MSPQRRVTWYLFLNSELLFRSLKELGSDRGAETYDFTLVAAEKKRERQREEKEKKVKGASTGKGNLGKIIIHSTAVENGEEIQREERNRVAKGKGNLGKIKAVEKAGEIQRE